MLRLRFATEAAARRKKGHAQTKHTGVANASSTKVRMRGDRAADTGCPGSMSPMATPHSGVVRDAARISRRVMSTISGSGPSASSAEGGPMRSRAMPHCGQAPGPSCTTSGSIGQVKPFGGALRTSLTVAAR